MSDKNVYPTPNEMRKFPNWKIKSYIKWAYEDAAKYYNDGNFTEAGNALIYCNTCERMLDEREAHRLYLIDKMRKAVADGREQRAQARKSRRIRKSSVVTDYDSPDPHHLMVELRGKPYYYKAINKKGMADIRRFTNREDSPGKSYNTNIKKSKNVKNIERIE